MTTSYPNGYVRPTTTAEMQEAVRDLMRGKAWQQLSTIGHPFVGLLVQAANSLDGEALPGPARNAETIALPIMTAQELALANEARAIIHRAINTLAYANLNEEADDLERDLRTCRRLPDFLMVREEAEDLLAILEADA